MLSGVLGVAIIFVACLFPALSHAQDATKDLLARGESVFNAAGCAACHTEDKDSAPALAGGRALETPFGTFYSPNITPHKEQGIGAWSAQDLWRSLTQGEGPSGTHYYPVFPFPSYAGIVREDSDALYQYLMSRPAHDRVNREHDLAWFVSFRVSNQIWKWLFFESKTFAPNTDKSKQWNRGAYLVNVLGHCAECHSPRSSLGVVESENHLSGNKNGPDGEAVPSLRSDAEESEFGDWDAEEIATYLKSGENPDFDFAGGAMVEVIEDNTSLLTDADREAIAAYLKDLPAL